MMYSSTQLHSDVIQTFMPVNLANATDKSVSNYVNYVIMNTYL